MAQENIDVTVQLHDRLSRPANQAERAIEDLDDAVDDLNASQATGAAATSRYERAMAALRRSLGSTTTESERLERSQRRQQNSTRLLSGGFGELGWKLKKSSDESQGFGFALKALKMPMYITGAHLLAGGVAAVGAAAMGAIAGLAPLVGVAGAIPALGAAALQAKGVFTLAMQGVTDAVGVLSDPTATAEQLSAALKDLSPQARSFAISLAEAKEQSDGLKNTVQAGLLPGMESALKSVIPLLPVVERNLGLTAKSLGANVAEAGRFAGTLGGDLNTVMERNTSIVDTLGKALVPLTSVFMNLLVAGGPLAQRFANALLAGAQQLQSWVQAGRDSGKLEAFFNRAGDLAAKVWSVLVDVSVGLFNIGRGAGDMAGDMGSSIERVAAKFREWTGSVEGKSSIKKFFDDAKPVIRETFLLLGDVAKAFGGIAADEAGTLAPMIKQIRTDLLPAIMALVNGISGSGLGPAFIDLATAYAEFSNVLSFDPLVTAVGIFGDLARWVTNLISLSPGLSTFLAAILTMKIVFNGLMAASKLTGITAFLTSMFASTGAIRIFTTTLFGSTAALGANGVATSRAAAAGLLFRNSLAYTRAAISAAATALWSKTKALAAATLGYARQGAAAALSATRTLAVNAAALVVRGGLMAWAAAQWLLNAALTANPIGIIIVALVALVAAVVLAWKHSETFRDIVLAAWGVIKAYIELWWTVIQAVFNALKTFVMETLPAAFRSFVGFVTGSWNAFTGMLGAGWSWIQTYVFAPIGNFVTVTIPGWFRAFLGFITGIWQGYQNMLRAGWDWIVSSVFQPIGNFVTVTIPGYFRTGVGYVTGAWDTFKQVIAGGWNWVRDNVFAPLGRFVTETIPGFFTAAVDTVRGIWDKLLDVIKTPIKIAFDFGNSYIIGPLNGILSKFPGNLQIPELPKLARGGPLRGPGTGTSDSILGVNTAGVPTALVSNGEHVWTKKEVDAAGGHGAIMQLRQAVLARRAVGGPIDSLPRYAEGGGIGGFLGDVGGAIVGGVKSAWNGVTGFASDMLAKGARWAAEKILGPLRSGYQKLLPADQVPLSMARGGLDRLFDAVLGKSDEQDRQMAAEKAAASAASGPAGPATANGNGGLGPAAIRARDFVRSNWGFAGTIGGYANRNIAGTNQLSKHALGKAIDVMTMSNMGLGQQIADYFAGPGRSPFGVDNVIWNRRIHSGRGWGGYSGVSPHTDHPHIDFFDRGGVASGRGLMPKGTLLPERVLSPEQTATFERLVRLLELSEPVAFARPTVGAAAPAAARSAGGDSGLPPLHFHFHGDAADRPPTMEMREWVLDVVRAADRERKERG